MTLLQLRVFLSTLYPKAIPAWNILADTPAGNKSNTVVLGSHLDSVTAGPGINDNGRYGLISQHLACFASKQISELPTLLVQWLEHNT